MAYYSYKGINLSNIYSTTEPQTSTTIDYYRNTDGSLIFRGENGSVSRQNLLGFNNLSNQFSFLSAYYIDYTSSSGTYNYNIPVDENVKQICVLLCGAGGSGGAGGGDRDGRYGANGGGGGGGGYVYAALTMNGISQISLTIGKGGASVSGGPDERNGYDGNSGGATTLTFYTGFYQTITATGGGGGGGGGADTAGTGGAGGGKLVDTPETLIMLGAAGTNTGNNSGNEPLPNGGISGFTLFQTVSSYGETYPKITGSYGNGGGSTEGSGNPNKTNTGAGVDGFARIYFKY